MSSPTLPLEDGGEKRSEPGSQNLAELQQENNHISTPIVIDLTLDDEDDEDNEAGPTNIERPLPNEAAKLLIKSEPDIESSSLEPQRGSGITSEILVECDGLAENIRDKEPIATVESNPSTSSKLGESDYAPQAVEEEETMEQMLQTFFRNRDNFSNDRSGAETDGQHDLNTEKEVDAVDSDKEDRAAGVAFQSLKRKYDAKKRSGKANLEDEIEFQKALNTEDERRRLRKSKQAYRYAEDIHDESSMFIPEMPASPQPEEDDVDQDRMTDADTMSSKHVDFVHDFCEISSGDDELQPPARTQKPPASRAGRSNVRGGRVKTSRDAVTKTPRGRRATARGAGSGRGRKAKKGGKPEVDMIDTSSLFRQNIIEAATANRQQAVLPDFSGKNRENALRDLIASMPEGQRDLHHGDKIDLKVAATKFTCSGSRASTAMRLHDDGGWRLKGMKTSLKNYQMIGSSFLRVRETSKTRPYGGMLSDEMGLGKTIMMIANIIDGIPNRTGENVPRATLIVVPPALITQWMQEIDKHTDRNVLRDVVLHRSGSRITATDPVRVLANNDVVITSYHEVLKSMPKNEPPLYLVSQQAKEEWWRKEWEEKRGVLHCIKWHRIVLDEAQAIKNYQSRTSEAVHHLDGRFRWAISGTPIQNGLEEFYAFFRFLRCPHTGSFDLFKQNFCKKGSVAALQRLQVYLAKIMCRRTHEDKMFGHPILVMPPIKPVETIEVEFNAVERAIYRIVHTRFVAKVRALGNVDKHYRTIFVLLLRLRQLVSSPLLIKKTIAELLEAEDMERLWQLTEEVELHTKDDGSRETLTVLEAALNTVTAEDPSIKTDSRRHSQSSSDDGILPNPHDPILENDNDAALTCNFRKYLQNLHDSGDWEKINDRSLCHKCGNPPVKPHLTSCMHMYCEDCLRELEYDAAGRDEYHATCLECGLRFKKAEAYAARAFEEAGGRKRKGRSGGRVTRKSNEEEEEDIDWIQEKGCVWRSAKTRGAVKKMKEWWSADPSAKIIIFVQFRALGKLFKRICDEHGWKFAMFHGAMSFEARDKAVKDFTEEAHVKVMIAALKAGGVGLNLVAANRVIICDLWWNQSVETQAWCRVFRIGQERDVEVARFVVKDSIDTEILEMQERKTKEVESAMDEKKRPSRLTTRELVQLFGPMPRLADEKGGGEKHNNGEDESFMLVDDPYEEKDDDVDMSGLFV